MSSLVVDDGGLTELDEDRSGFKGCPLTLRYLAQLFFPRPQKPLWNTFPTWSPVMSIHFDIVPLPKTQDNSLLIEPTPVAPIPVMAMTPHSNEKEI